MLLRGGEGNPKGFILSILAHFCGNQSEYVNRSSEGIEHDGYSSRKDAFPIPRIMNLGSFDYNCQLFWDSPY